MASIKQVGIYLPEKIVTNDDLKQEFPEADFKSFEDSVGIKSRHIAASDETALDLAEKAAKSLLEDVEDASSSIDFLLFCTQTPDYHTPGNAGILQDRLGLDKNIGALDFNLGCSGYVYGLALAKSLISAGMASRILFAAGDTFSKYIHTKDRVNRAMFGDAASATIIDSENDGIGEFVFGTDGSGFRHLIIPNGAARNEMDPEAEEFEYGTDNISDDNHFHMDGLQVFSFTANKVPKLVKDTLAKNKLEMQDIDHFVFHQANEYMLNFLKKKLKIDDDKFHINMKDVGNTSSCTIPIVLNDLYKDDRIKPGQKVLLAGYGIGLSWAGVVVNF